MMNKETNMEDKITRATHVLYRSDFRDPMFWDMILEAHGIEQSEEDDIQYDEITIRATVESYQ